MPTLREEGIYLVVGLSWPEKLLAVHGNLRVPRSSVRTVTKVARGIDAAPRGVRIGSSLPGVNKFGTWFTRGGRTFAAATRAPGVVIELDGGQGWDRIVVSAPWPR